MFESQDVGGLTAEEKKFIHEYVQSAEVEQAIGQLFMVGLPADINTIRDGGSTDVDRVMGHDVGFVLPQSYTYYDNKSLAPDEYLSKVIDFNNAVQAKALKGTLRLPALIASDFEGPTIAPVSRGLVIPPSALSLGATQDQLAIQLVGGLVGSQLRNIGVHILLGPVLDVYNIKQGNKNGLLDRSFASTPEGVARTASNFMYGARHAGISLVAKHYPSHGAIETNPHSRKNIPKYEGSDEQRAGELKPFLENSKGLDGVMTAHIQIDKGKGQKLATFSPDLVKEIRHESELADKILITDDLSSMGAIGKYMDDNNATYADIAIQAFDAGHDVLMFAHVTKTSESSKKASSVQKFSVADFENVVAELAKHVKSSHHNEDQFRKSLERILSLKVRIAKTRTPNAISILNSKSEETCFHIPFNGAEAIRRSQDELAKQMQQHSPSHAEQVGSIDVRRFVMNMALEKSAVTLSSGPFDPRSFAEFPSDTKVLVAAEEHLIKKYVESFSSNFSDIKFMPIPTEKSGKRFRKFEEDLRSTFPGIDYLVYSVGDESDADLLSRLSAKYKKDYTQKVLIFLHASPAILNSELIGASSIVGTFTHHPEATDVDIAILKGNITPRGLSNFPVNVGDNGKYYSVTNTSWVTPSTAFQFNKTLSSSEFERAKEIVKAEFILVPKGLNTAIWGLLIACCATLPFLARRAAIQRGKDPNAKFDWVWLPFKSKLGASVIAVLIAGTMFLLLFMPEDLAFRLHQWESLGKTGANIKSYVIKGKL